MRSRIDDKRPRSSDRVGMARTIIGGLGRFGRGGGTGEEREAKDRQIAGPDARQTITDHDAPSAFQYRIKRLLTHPERWINRSILPLF
jgi:hypothetical protein